MKRVIVTGATGFIGRNLVKELASKGVEVWTIVRNKKNTISSLPNVHIVECKGSQYKELVNIIPKGKLDVFYHLAWAGVSGKERSDYNIQLDNIRSTCDAVMLAKELEANRFVFAGSIMEYEYKKCIDENFIKSGLGNMYGIAKMNARQMAQTLSYNLKLNFNPVTISNVYGIGEVSERFINSTIRKLLDKERTSFTKGDQLYDFIYIDDAVRALYLIGNFGKPFKNYYIGNRHPRKLKEFIFEMKDCVDQDIKLGIGEIPYNSISLNYNEFDTNGLFDDFGFTPEIDFKQGVQKTIEWIYKQKNTF